MESNKPTDFKANAADLTKIPPYEFEKYFQEWMERDDVARSLQSKLRCDLIKNFNKTNLGKHILSHTMTSSGGATMRLTLSPLVLALNTLVAEFLYAQNCHFTLSVFCTEIPFRNTLPDFESVRRFRFNNEEILEIWQAVTGSKVNKCDLNKNIIKTYQTNPNASLLLLIIKCLLKKDPLDQLKRNVEVQTETQGRAHKSISAQSSDQERTFTTKAKAKDDNLHYINKYLLTLSEKVIEMTKEFEHFSKQTREAKTRHQKYTRSREYYTLNKSLERITENIKVMVQTKRKSKQLSNIVESIDHLTQQFGKCAHNFDSVIKVLCCKDNKSSKEKSRPTKVRLKEKQTETELQEKSYIDWIHEMRNTENGKKFLNRVEISLRKALRSHREQLENETQIKIKHLKSLMKLHYQQKFSKHLLQDPKINLEEARKCNDTIDRKLQQFEKKQLELLHILQESSLELKEAQQKESSKLSGESDKEKLARKDDSTKYEHVPKELVRDNLSTQEIQLFDLQESQRHEVLREKLKQHKTVQTNEERTPQTTLGNASKAQEEILDIALTMAEQGRSVDRIIYDAKLRIQQLEIESNQLEKNFQSYLERRKLSQEQDNNQLMPNFKDLYEITSAYAKHERKRSIADQKELVDESDEEFNRLKETLLQTQELSNEIQKSAKSETSSSSLEIRNAILEAKLKFFEHESTLRKCREKGEEIRHGSFLQKQLETGSEKLELMDYFNNKFGQFISETNLSVETQTQNKDVLDFNLESNLTKINMDINAITGHKSQNILEQSPTSARRELFQTDVKPNEEDIVANSLPAHDLQIYSRYHEPAILSSKDHDQHLSEENIHQKSAKRGVTTSNLIKQSMAKMQQLFEQRPKSQETLMEIVNEMQQERASQSDDLKNTTNKTLRPNEALDKSLTATITSTSTTTSKSPKSSEESVILNNHKMLKSIPSLNRISNISMPSMLNLSSESEDSNDSNHHQRVLTTNILDQIDVEEITMKDLDTSVTPHQALPQINKTNQSSKTYSPPPIKKKYEETEPNLQLDFGQINSSPESHDLNKYNPDNDKEIGELFTESDRVFVPIDDKSAGSTSSRSSSVFEIISGHQNKDAKNLADDSEHDFWT